MLAIPTVLTLDVAATTTLRDVLRHSVIPGIQIDQPQRRQRHAMSTVYRVLSSEVDGMIMLRRLNAFLHRPHV